MRLRSLITGVLTVLAVAAIAFVARGALQGDEDPAPRVAARAAAATGATGTTAADPSAALASGLDALSAIPKGASTIATARGRSVRVYATAHTHHARRLRQRTFNGQRIPLTFLVRTRRAGRVQVELPTRPNQSRGWVRASDVRLTFTRLTIEVRRKAHRLRVLDGKRDVLSTRIGVGESISPTPPGRYFVTDVVRTKDPRGFYGPYALGLSAHSTVYTSFEGGDGQVGIHGTNQPRALGTDVSHGCIRVRNDVIRRLARQVPLGTPVVIRS